MFEFVDNIALWTPGFMLTLARMTGLMMTLPIFSYQLITPRVRVMLIFVLTVIVYPMAATALPEMDTLWSLATSVFREFGTGLFIGFGARVIFEALNMAGAFVGRQMGLAIANVMDPTTNRQLPVISQFWFLVMIVFFLVVDGHHLFIETIFRNYTILPLGGSVLTADAGETMIRSGSTAFAMSLRLAAPAMVFLLLVDTAIALIARVMPQMNIFIITLPLKIATGIFILIVSIDIFQLLFDSVFQEIGIYFQTIMMNMKQA